MCDSIKVSLTEKTQLEIVQIVYSSVPNNCTLSMLLILQQSWLKAAICKKVDFLSQILDYNSHIWLKFEFNGPKKPLLLIRTAPFYLRRYIGLARLVPVYM